MSPTVPDPVGPRATGGPTGSGAPTVGLTGLGVMGTSLARNIARHGIPVAVHNRTPDRTHEVVAAHGHEGPLVPADDLPGFVAAIARPRTVIVMVPAGPATGAVVDALTPLLEEGDTIVDAGNAHFLDSERRSRDLSARGIAFVGCGVSGGEEGALNGPSIMPGCTPEAYERVRGVLESIAASVDGEPCCRLIGTGGSGHYVKMVHNGIEYADMQVISETYALLRTVLPVEGVADVFAAWNDTELSSYLVEITAEVLAHRDASGRPFVDVVDDAAGNKGTGAWTTRSALELGVPVTAIAEATFARMLSARGEQRAAVRAVGATTDPPVEVAGGVGSLVEDLRLALYAAKVMAYAQGFDQIAAASREYGWDVDLASLATIWRGGCIIRARFLDDVRRAYERDPGLVTLVADPFFADAVRRGEAAWRRVVVHAVASRVPIPAFATSLTAWDALRSPVLPTALIQAQRDFFGAHTYRRVDRPGSFHTRWADDRGEVRA